MKKGTICIILLIFSTISFSQQTTSSTNSATANANTDYLKKSKNQKNTAWILLGGGTAMVVGGIIAYQQGPGGIFLTGIGFLAQVASVPFFIAAGKNKRKARNASVSLKFENNEHIQPAEISFRSYPAISLKLNL